MRRLRTCRRLLDADEAGVSGNAFKYWDSSMTESERIRISFPCFSDTILSDSMYDKPDFFERSTILMEEFYLDSCGGAAVQLFTARH